ncbi:competence protein ComGB [Weissella oryzae SG25]|uniref:Competence protein ComGB n=1 Tax=Weissella oryzae (strain DSM 25784 / JCM 18191 / LMG 30913 / SG25) TaxID=1329250 RepID=A0A069CS59_WEIOS|nr:type II secretion system F family protein [Weissella oryzae]GAK30650.1 competence protein ComGB [Weissella oryzae SG25]
MIFFKTKRWSRKKQAIFFKQLGQLIKAGYSLNRALILLSVILNKECTVIITMQKQLQDTANLPEILKPYVHRSIVRELSFVNLHGNLTGYLTELGERIDRQVRQENRLRQLMYYPVFLIVITLIIACFFAMYLLPLLDISETFSGLNILIKVLYLTVVIFGIVIYGYKVKFARLSKLTQLKWLLKLPYFGQLLRLYFSNRVALHLALLFENGVGLIQIIEYCRKCEDNPLLMESAQLASLELQKGDSLVTLLTNSQLFSPQLAHIFQQGKRQNEIGEDLLRIARNDFTHFEQKLNQLFVLIQPTIFIVVAAVIVWLYMMLLTPMYGEMEALLAS